MYGEFNLEKMYQINHVICYVLAWHMYSETSSLSYSTNATLKTKFINSFVESSDSSIYVYKKLYMPQFVFPLFKQPNQFGGF